MDSSKPTHTIIPSPVRRYQLPLIVGGVTLLIAMLFAQQALPQFKPQLMLFTLVAIVLIVAGLALQLEPKVSLSLSDSKIRYFHRFGQWSLPWHEIARIFIPSFTDGLARQDIPYIGIKIKDLDVISERISPRLASRIIHEQRGIMALGYQQGDIDSAQLPLNFSPYKTKDGCLISGPIAAFMHQAVILNQAYGAHLFIPESCFSDSSEQMIVLLNQYC